MLYGAYISAAGALANSYRQDVHANNLANVETVAFKRDLALVQARATASTQNGASRFTAPLLEGIGGGIFALPTQTDYRASSLEATTNPYDVALGGKGFFQIQKGDEVLYTRDGRLGLNEEGLLVTQNEQLPILNREGQVIKLDRDADFVVNEAGVISQNGEEAGRLGVVDFADTRGLRKRGENMYAAEGVSAAAIDGVVKQNYLEKSGVNSITEMVGMIQAQRMFQTNLEMLQLQDQTLGSALTQLGRLT